MDLTNSAAAVGALTINPVVFNGGTSSLNTAFDPLQVGATTLSIVQPTDFTAPSNVNTSITATVTGP